MSAWEGPSCIYAGHASYFLDGAVIDTNQCILSIQLETMQPGSVESLNRAGRASLAVNMPGPAMHSVNRGSSYLAAHSDLPCHLIERAR